MHIGFVAPKLITAVATQGRADQDQWITQYLCGRYSSSPILVLLILFPFQFSKCNYLTQKIYNMKYTIDGHTWNWVENKRSFSGNNNRNSISKHVFDQPFKALSVRIHPTLWSGRILLFVLSILWEIFTYL